MRIPPEFFEKGTIPSHLLTPAGVSFFCTWFIPICRQAAALMISAADTFHSKAYFFKNCNQPFSLIALNLDATILDRASCAALLLELASEFEQARFIERHVEYGRHTFATPSLGFPTDFHHDSARRRFLLRIAANCLVDEILRWRFHSFAATNQSSRQAHDFTFD